MSKTTYEHHAVHIYVIKNKSPLPRETKYSIRSLHSAVYTNNVLLMLDDQYHLAKSLMDDQYHLAKSLLKICGAWWSSCYCAGLPIMRFGVKISARAEMPSCELSNDEYTDHTLSVGR